MGDVIWLPWVGRPDEVELVGLEDGRVLELYPPTCRGYGPIDEVKTRQQGGDE